VESTTNILVAEGCALVAKMTRGWLKHDLIDEKYAASAVPAGQGEL
jgi:hypothetical protein